MLVVDHEHRSPPPHRRRGRIVVPFLVALAVLGVGVVLTAGGGGRSVPPASAVPSTTTSVGPGLALDWMLTGDATRGGLLDATAVHVVDRDREVVRFRRAAPDARGSGSLLRSADVQARVGETLHLGADLRVDGGARAGLYLRISGADIEQLAVGTTAPDDEVVEGGWERRSLDVLVPVGATDVTYGIYLRGAGWVDVDAVEGP